MKLIISNHSNHEIKEDSMLISPLNGCNIYNLEDLVADGECEEIFCDCLNQATIENIADLIEQYVRKLRKNGKIIFTGTDLYMLANYINNRAIDLEEINNLIFGGPSANLMNSSLICINDLVGFLNECGLKIVNKNLNELKYRVEAVLA